MSKSEEIPKLNLAEHLPLHLSTTGVDPLELLSGFPITKCFLRPNATTAILLLISLNITPSCETLIKP